MRLKTVFLALALTLFIAACGGGPVAVSQLIGVWEGTVAGDTDVSMMLNEDGSAELITAGPQGDGLRTGNWRRDSRQIVVQILKSGSRSVNERISFYYDDGELTARGWTIRGKYVDFGAEPMVLVRRKAPAVENGVQNDALPPSEEEAALIITKQVAAQPADPIVGEALAIMLGETATDARYLHSHVDLNDDATVDVLATVTPCPESGCTLYVFEGAADGGLNPVGSISGVSLPVIIGFTGTTWRDIFSATQRDGQPTNMRLSFAAGSYPKSIDDGQIVTGTVKGETHLGAAQGPSWGNPVNP